MTEDNLLLTYNKYNCVRTIENNKLNVMFSVNY